MAVEQLVGLEVGRNGPRIAVGGKVEFGPLVGDGERIDAGDLILVAEAHAVVEEAETHREPRAGVVRKTDGHLIAVVAHLLVFAPGLAPLLVDGAALDAADTETRIEHRLAALETQSRGQQQLPAVGPKRVTHAPRIVHIEKEFITPVGRSNARVGRTGCAQQYGRERQQKKSFHGISRLLVVIVRMARGGHAGPYAPAVRLRCRRPPPLSAKVACMALRHARRRQSLMS